VPGPGLTIVTGRNGSGKSSFAEAAELALTGDNRRWAGRARVWQDGWRNLHTTGDRFVRVGLAIEGKRGGATVECHWSSDADLNDRTSFLQLAGQRRQSVADLGWERPLELYRPFLSYSELGGLLNGRPIDMHEALHSVLGLGRPTEVEDRLKHARRDSDQTRKAASAALPGLQEVLGAHPDPRARQAEELLAASTVDVDQLDQLAAGTDTGGSETVDALRALDALTLAAREQVAEHVAGMRAAREQIAVLSTTPAAEARMLAGLLRDALSYHQHLPGRPCPVCGGRSLDPQWAEGAQVQVQRPTVQAEQLEQAHRAVAESGRYLRELVPTMPTVLNLNLGDAEVDPSKLRTAWQTWDDLLRSDDVERIAAGAIDRFDAVATALTALQAVTRQALERRRLAWQPVSEQIRAWTETARRSRLAALTYTASRKALEWLRTVGEQVRNERLAPLATGATEIWALLRQDSNVDLGTIRLAGTGNQRRVDLNVAVDGASGAALGVMSQGELHALALSLFLPRAAMTASPFRFLVIDDPVQSMDPAKVYGLARVLERTARARQVVVFTTTTASPLLSGTSGSRPASMLSAGVNTRRSPFPSTRRATRLCATSTTLGRWPRTIRPTPPCVRR
jgi:recombinational DNA repair ATPase RecF